MPVEKREPRHTLISGLVGVAVGDAYVVDGGPTRVALTGPGASDLLPELCALLDGTRSIAEIADSLDVVVQDVEDAIALLQDNGLTELIPAGHEPVDGSHDAHAFFARAEVFAARRGSGAHAFAGICTADVVVAGEGQMADLVRSVLVKQGIAVSAYSTERLSALPKSDGILPPTAFVVEIFQGKQQRSAEIQQQCYAQRIPWIGAVINSDGGQVGPIVHDSCACPSCAWSALPDPEEGTHDVLPPGLVLLIAGLLAGEVVNGLAGIASNHTATGVIRVIWEAGGSSAVHVAKERLYRPVECVPCSAPGLTATAEAQLAWNYEQQIALPPPQFVVTPRRWSNATQVYKTQRDLPTSPVLPSAQVPKRPAHLTDMFAVLRRTSGLRETNSGGLSMWHMPSAGNRASQQGFVVSQEAIGGLDSHTAWYDPVGDQLVATGRVGAEEVSAIAATALGDLEWGWLLIWVADIDQLAQKYQDFAVRLALLDSGVALAQSLVVAETLGLAPRMLGAWSSENWVNLLDLNPRAEAVTGVLIF
ncbi:hypothetical protein OID55_41675 (plasmid) [Streptomyces sp. NBC_00715]|uniref:hypothetical protein n=1 Tax=Streptomyces sp. NBC_00715 TaxID=2975811 RepID=UPI002F90E59C